MTGALDTLVYATTGSHKALVIPPHSDPRRAGPICATVTGTREVSRGVAIRRLRKARLALGGDCLAFKRVDSLFRGHQFHELATTFALGRWPRCILAPAFPSQGRLVSRGRIVQQSGRHCEPIADLISRARCLGIPISLNARGNFRGISVFDAASDSDLAELVAEVDDPREVLWAGSAGLGKALFGSPLMVQEGPSVTLGLVGSDHPITEYQLAAVAGVAPWFLTSCADTAIARIAQGLSVLFRPHIPPGTKRSAARDIIAAQTASLLTRSSRPEQLYISGGETLAAVCEAMAVRWLVLDGLIEEGFIASRIVGGPFDSMRLLTKSGSLGDAKFLQDRLPMFAGGSVADGETSLSSYLAINSRKAS